VEHKRRETFATCPNWEITESAPLRGGWKVRNGNFRTMRPAREKNHPGPGREGTSPTVEKLHHDARNRGRGEYRGSQAGVLTYSCGARGGKGHELNADPQLIAVGKRRLREGTPRRRESGCKPGGINSTPTKMSTTSRNGSLSARREIPKGKRPARSTERISGEIGARGGSSAPGLKRGLKIAPTKGGDVMMKV